MRTKPITKPSSGERNMGTMTFHSRPAPLYQCSALGCDQMMTCQLSPEAASAAPQRPPMSAWMVLEGRPNHQVMRFQMIAANKAQIRTLELIETSLVSTRPPVMVLATAEPTM